MIIEGIEKISSLPQPALGLLPAVHDAEVESYDDAEDPLPTVAAGQVFQNDTDGAVTLPAYGPWPAKALPVGGYAASDGRFWFPAKRYKETNSFYSTAFEKTLYTLAFTSHSLALRTPFALSRLYSFRLLANNTDAVWNVVWEIGMRANATSPAPIGPNISEYTFREPLIDEQVHITDVASTHGFGISLYRDLVGENEVWTGTATRYGKQLAALSEQLPTGNDFVLRLRLSCFDTLDTVTDPRGYVAFYASNLQIK